MQALDLERKAMAARGGEGLVEADVAAVRLEVAVLLRRVVVDVAALERKFAVLRQRGGADEQLVEAVLATRMAMGTLGPLAERWAARRGDEVEVLAAMVGRVLREALAAGSAHVETQSGAPRPCAPGVAADGQGLIEVGEQRWDPRGGTVLYWLEDRRPAGEPGCFAMGGAELVAALKSERRGLAGHSERRLLKEALEAGVVLADPRQPERWSQLVKIAGKGRRVVVIPAELVFPALAGGADGDHRDLSVDDQVARVDRAAPLGPGPDTGEGEPPAPQVPGWLMDRVGRLDARRRVELAGRLEAAGLVGRTLNHDELVTVEGWVAAAERSETSPEGGGRPSRAARAAPSRAVPPPRPPRGPSSAPARPGAALPPAQPTRHRSAPNPSPARAAQQETPASAGTSRYRYVATDGRRVVAGDGASVGGGPWAHVGELVDAARQLVPDGEVIVAVHPAAHFLLGLPETKGDMPQPGGEGLRLRFGSDALDEATSVREVGDSGGLVVERAGRARVQVMFPAYSGEFAGAADAAGLVEAIELFCAALGFGYLYSAASTVHRLIEFTQPRGKRLGPPAVHPVLDPPYAPMGYSVPAAAWSRPLSAAERARDWVVVCDRNGSYLSAWGSCVVADGPWAHQTAPFPLPAGKEPSRPAGYWLMDAAELAAITPPEWPDPFRRHRLSGDKVWLTTPLVQLAADLAGDRQLTVAEAWTAERFRPLDEAAARLAKARTQLLGDGRPAARVALAAVKAGYVAATAWFEFGARPPAPLARPDWRRTIHDRFMANTWRSLHKSLVAPFALTDVDAAVFALDDPTAPPEGLPVGADLRSWKAKGAPVPMAQAVAALDAGGPGAVIELAEADN